ncbi:creatininase family protein [Amycolatopsis magusensis]|uniref:Creatinine amidohydrolase n=1 Tax=Amycolatopsis magusensis TaxID=882444 RepID=A0ABS4PP71_9PSEU|nr:creatininase family protein [Amycolatopsis magusensis]MBP2181219.1 creatinine amidohydrolase [Amycolatopsis magusensis]MDI5977363.1 creatininase family protein [Amycolatopsis magusensis]
MYFAELTSPEVDALLTGSRVPVLLLPVGAVEPHGPHAPLGTDPLISQGMCERAARQLADDPEVRVLILPALPYGVTKFARGFAGGVHIGADTLFSLVVDVCRALAEQGLGRVVIVNNHFEPEHVATLRRAAEAAGAAYLDLVRRRNAERLTEEFRSGSCHAGQYETSLVLADRPELVDIAAMRELPAVPVDLPSAMRAGQADFRDMGMSAAYCGAPAEATAEEGAETFATLTEMLVETIRATAKED